MATTRDIADRLTGAVLNGDIPAIMRCYAANAVLSAPEGTFRGREEIEHYWRSFQVEPFSDSAATFTAKFEAGDIAVDEWIFSATHTGPLDVPGGDAIPATGRRVSLRGADVGVVRDGAITEHRLYYDQAELLTQIGLTPAGT
jgi:ketosteroid isomerase-like protein